MKITIKDLTYDVIILDSIYKRVFYLMNKKNLSDVYYIQNTNTFHTFLYKSNIDIIGINEKSSVIFKYINVPTNRLIEINNDKKNTNILVFPKFLSKSINIGDVLSFICEDEI